MNEEPASSNPNPGESQLSLEEPSAAGERSTSPSAEGPPKTGWAVAALLIGALPVFSWAFETWDGSEFNFAITHPYYWLGVSALVLLAAVWAVLVREKGNWLDTAIILILVLGVVGASVKSVLTWRDTIPPDGVFTVRVFSFLGDNDTTRNAAGGFRGTVISSLNEMKGRHPGEFDVKYGGRIEGDDQEQLASVQKWARRRGGANLAIWLELHLQENGSDYQGTAHYVKIYPFGKEVNREELGTTFREDREPFRSKPVGRDNLPGPDVLKSVVDSTLYFWGLARYLRGDYDGTLHVIPGEYSHAEYYSGRAALDLARITQDPKRLYDAAEGHFRQAIHLEKDELVTARYYLELAIVYSDELVSGLGNREARADLCIKACQKSEELLRKLNYPDLYGFAVGLEAKTIRDSSGDLRRAEALYQMALGQMSPKSSNRYELLIQLGALYIDMAAYQSAIRVLKEAINSLSAGREGLKALEELAVAQTRSAIANKDTATFDEGIRNFDKSSALCSTAGFDCYKLHWDKASAELSGASLWERSSTPWSSRIELAIKEFAEAERLTSSQDQPEIYAQVKSAEAAAYTERAVGVGGDDRVRSLEAALAELNDAISTLERAGLNAGPFHKQRAECYRRLAKYSDDKSRADEYRVLAERDEEAGRKKANGKAPKADYRVSITFD